VLGLALHRKWQSTVTWANRWQEECTDCKWCNRHTVVATRGTRGRGRAQECHDESFDSFSCLYSGSTRDCQEHACDGMEATESIPVPKSRRLKSLHSPLRMALRRRCCVSSEIRGKGSPLFSMESQPCVVRSRFVSFPLLGLEAIRRAKSTKCTQVRFMLTHADEIKGPLLSTLETMEMEFDKDSCTRGSLIIFMSPQSLMKGSSWRNILEHLAKNQLISGITFDEAHCVPQQGKTFRKDSSAHVRSGQRANSSGGRLVRVGGCGRQTCPDRHQCD
jgi:hypothetical protein